MCDIKIGNVYNKVVDIKIINTEDGFDNIRFELPTYKILYKEGNYTEEEINMFIEILEKSAPSLYKWAREE